MYYEGRPLVYYYDYQMPSSYATFPYFRRFEERSRMSDEFLLPNSPHSAQSDSDASVSSIDVHPEPIKGKFNVKSNANSTARCCWQNCGIAFESLEKLSDHVGKVHAVSGLGGLYYCLWEGCTRNNKGFNARYKMLVHVRTHTNEKPHRCTLCHKSFSRAENLKIHTRSHSGERPYLCPVPGCNKAYSNSSDRFKHTRTHQVDKPYQCKVAGCTKRYTDPSSLRKHVKTYKHFVETIKNEERDAKGILESDKVNCVEESSRLRSDSESSIGCSCDHLPQCYYSNRCLEREFIGRMNEERTTKWRSFMEPYLRDERDEMEIELPLDLSIRRHY